MGNNWLDTAGSNSESRHFSNVFQVTLSYLRFEGPKLS